MKHKGLILTVVIVGAILALILLPGQKKYGKVASIGKPAPEFELKDSNGNMWKSSDLRGKVVFINFWATWCTTCKAEMPHKEGLYKKMQGRPFQMFGVLFRDNPKNLESYFKKNKVSLPTLISPGDKISRLFGISGVPETFIMDKEWIVREKIVGPREWDSPETMALIEKWL